MLDVLVSYVAKKDMFFYILLQPNGDLLHTLFSAKKARSKCCEHYNKAITWGRFFS
jgi:hypothetical protein